MTELRAFSYGGGVQSTAALVLAAQGKIDFPLFLFANVGAYERRCYPLLDLRISRDGCEQIIRDAGLEVPRKSSCFFCPFHRPSVWVEMQRDEPDLFAQAVEMEAEWFVPRGYYLTRFGKPLDVAIGPDIQQAFDFEYGGFESCDEGVCFV